MGTKLSARRALPPAQTFELSLTEGVDLRFQLASDIHLEFFPPSKIKDEGFESIVKPNAPVLALLGDIGCPNQSDERGLRQLQAFLEWTATQFQHVFYLTGNHEYYNAGRSERRTTAFANAKIAEICEPLSNVHFLQGRDVYRFADANVDVIGGILWSHVPPEQEEEVGRGLNDYRNCWVSDPKVSDGLRLLTVGDTNAIHERYVAFLERELRLATENGHRVLVLTHHGPTFSKSCEPKYKNSKVRTAFCTDLERFFHKPRYAALDTWCFGHTHYSSDQVIGHSRIVSNQHGYVITPHRLRHGEHEVGYRVDFSIAIGERPEPIGAFDADSLA